MLTYSLYKHALSTRNKQFWFLQLIGWSGYSFVVFISVVAPYSNNQKIVTQLQTLFMESATGVIFTLLLRTIFRWTWHKPVYTKVIVSLLSAFAASACWTITKHLSYRYLRDYDLLPITWIEFGGWFLFSLATMLAWTTFYYAILNYVELQAQNKKTLQAQNDAQLAQLKMLRYQLNPHFIFNAINAVSTLILKNENAKALSTLQKMSEMLRYSLDCDPLNKISIKQEVDFLHKYLKIEKIRYANRLTIKTYIAPTAENYLVPNLIMQPLVENAIKHGISKAINGGLIIIRVDILETTLKLTVQDSGHGVADINSLNSSPGIGITNIVSRLQNLYNGHATLNFSAVSPQGLRAVILLPLENA